MTHSLMTMSFVVILVMINLAHASQTSAIPSLQISEIMFNPDGDENAREFVEMYNPGDVPVELTGWMIGDNDALDDIIPVNGGSAIPVGSYALIIDPDYFDSGEPYDIPPDAILLTIDDNAIGSRGLSNSTAETVYLVSAAGDTVVAVTYDLSCTPGHSWEMIRIDGGMDSRNFAPSSVPEGTPGYRNSVAPPRLNPALDSSSIILVGSDFSAGEILSGTVSFVNAGSEPLEGIEVALAIAPDIRLGTCRFDDMVAHGERSAACGFTSGPLPGGALELVVVISAPYLDQPAVDDTVCVSLPVAIPPGTIILNEVMAAPADGPEWIELRNSGEWPVDLYMAGVRWTAPGLCPMHRSFTGSSCPTDTSFSRQGRPDGLHSILLSLPSAAFRRSTMIATRSSFSTIQEPQPIACHLNPPGKEYRLSALRLIQVAVL